MTIQGLQEALTSPAPKRVHLIGVAGSGMSGIAALLLALGHQVSGSDKVVTVEVERLQKKGLSFESPQTAASIRDAEIRVARSASSLRRNRRSRAQPRSRICRSSAASPCAKYWVWVRNQGVSMKYSPPLHASRLRAGSPTPAKPASSAAGRRSGIVRDHDRSPIRVVAWW